MKAEFRLEGLLAARPGLSQSRLARDAGVSVQTVNAITNNRTTRVDLATLAALADALGCEPGELVGRQGGKPRRRGGG